MPIEKEDGGVDRKLTPAQVKNTTAQVAALAAAKSKNVKELTKAQVEEVTAKVVMDGGKSTDPKNRLKGETATQANARITAAYKEMTAKPVLSEEQIKAGAKVQFVRTGAGGQGEYTVVVPPGYKGPRTTTQWTDGIIPGNSKYTTGSSVGTKISGGKVVSASSTTKTSTTTSSTTSTAQTGIAKTITDALGSDLEKFRVDPATGKQRTSQEIVNAAIKAGLELPDSAWGTSYDEKTGKNVPWTQQQKIAQIVKQISANATRNAPNREFSKDVANYLGSNTDAVVRNYLQNDKTSWKYQPGFIEGTAGESGKVVLDPTKTTLSADELKQYAGKNINFIDPVTGNTVDVDINTGAIQWGDLKERIDSSNNKNDGTDGTDSTDNTGDGNNDGTDNGNGNGNADGSYDNAGNKLSLETKDAYALLESTFKMYGLEELTDQIKNYMERGLGTEEATAELRKSEAYQTRFKGNQARLKSGLNALSEAEYLALEDSYSSTLRAYGLQGYFGTERKARNAAMADIIGNDISAKEFLDRVDTVVTRVNNADPNIKATLRSFYNIGDTDLVTYFLNPKENLPKLQEKVTAAEIGSEFIKQGLTSGVTSAEEFAKLGIDKEAAAKGAKTIAGFLPGTTFLASLSPEEKINYSQQTAEEEVMKGLESARRKRLTLAEKEIGRFSGSSGTSRVSLGGARGSTF